MGTIGKVEHLLSCLVERDINGTGCLVDVDHVVNAIDLVDIFTHMYAKFQVFVENFVIVLLLELVA